MAQWSANDIASNCHVTGLPNATGSPKWSYALVKQPYQVNANSSVMVTTNETMFGNTTGNAFVIDQVVSIVGVDENEIGVDSGITHTGWHKRTEGQGGRAGRVHYECLVAGGIITDASDDAVLPDLAVFIDEEPVSLEVDDDGPGFFTVVAHALPLSVTNVTYQWFHANDDPVTDNSSYNAVDTATLEVVNAIAQDGNGYYVVVTANNGTDEVTVNSVTVTITDVS